MYVYFLYVYSYAIGHCTGYRQIDKPSGTGNAEEPDKNQSTEHSQRSSERRQQRLGKQGLK